MVLLFINNNLKMVHYNDLSALLNMAVIFFVPEVSKQDKRREAGHRRRPGGPQHIYPSLTYSAWAWRLPSLFMAGGTAGC